MKLELIPMLQMQRDLYDMPRGWERFRRYLERMVGDSNDVELLPMVAMHPLGKEHVATTYDVLLDLHAEEVAGAALAEAEQRRAHVGGQFRVGLVVADDLGGGWTNHYTTAMNRFYGQAALKRGGFWLSSGQVNSHRSRSCANTC